MIPEKPRKIVGWVLTVLLGMLFLASAGFKFSGKEEVAKQFSELGLAGRVPLIGGGEAVSAVLFLIPQTFPLGVLLLSGYMGGAIMAHMSHHEPFVAQSIILLVIWLTAFLRRPQMFLDRSIQNSV